MLKARNIAKYGTLGLMKLALLIVLGACDTQGILPTDILPGAPDPNPTPKDTPTPDPEIIIQSPVEKGDFIFSLKTEPIEGFTFLNTGAIVEHWTLRPPMIQGRMFIAGAALNERVYAIGGNTLASAVATVEMLDLPGTGVWSQVAPLSSLRTGIAAAAANGRIYAIGGFPGGAAHEEYDPETDKWTPRTPNPTPRAYATAVTVNGKIYLMGGSVLVNNVFQDSTSVDEYDPETDQWTPKAPLPVGVSTHAAAEVNGKIHVLLNSIHQEYDPVLNTWTPRKPMVHSRNRLGAFGFNGRLFAVGGREGAVAFSDAVEEYFPEFDGWEQRLPMSSSRHSFGYAAIGPSFYRLGGIEPGGQQGNFEDNVAIEYFAHTVVFPFRKD